MPILSEFFGIEIRMWPTEHGVAHFHARYEGRTVSIGIRPLAVLRGSIRQRALMLVLEWALQHQQELESAWNDLRAGREPGRIEPL